jgi:threonine dehydrogenase-like Zn-dependent dehydrogenase
MLAMTYRGPSRVRVEQKLDPRIEHPEDAILRITRTTICGSDIHLYHGLVPDLRVGHTFGHEFTGVVEEVGPAVENVKKGDRVVVPFNIFCGRCYFCSRQLYSSCENVNPATQMAGGAYGYSHTTGGYDGGQAEYVRIPFANAGPFKIPDDMHEEDVLFLSDIFPTGYQAAEMGEIKTGETVVIFGAGPVGLFAMKGAWLMGAGRVIVVDQVDYRLDFARQYAQVETVNFREVDNVVLHLRKMTENRGPDVCIDAVGCEALGSAYQTLTGRAMLQAGSATAASWAIESVRRGGNVVLIGVYGPPNNMVPIGIAMNKGITIRTAQCNVKRYMPRLLDHIRSGRVDAKALISHRMPLEEVAEGYHLFVNKLENVRKIVLIPPMERGA